MGAGLVPGVSRAPCVGGSGRRRSPVVVRHREAVSADKGSGDAARGTSPALLRAQSGSVLDTARGYVTAWVDDIIGRRPPAPRAGPILPGRLE